MILRLAGCSRRTRPASSPKSRRRKKSRRGRAGCSSSWCPTPKIIAELRDWFPKAKIIGWKFEADGGRAEANESARRQMAECRTDACVANGPAYGGGFGLATRDGNITHLANAPLLFDALGKIAAR